MVRIHAQAILAPVVNVHAGVNFAKVQQVREAMCSHILAVPFDLAIPVFVGAHRPLPAGRVEAFWRVFQLTELSFKRPFYSRVSDVLVSS